MKTAKELAEMYKNDEYIDVDKDFEEEDFNLIIKALEQYHDD